MFPARSRFRSCPAPLAMALMLSAGTVWGVTTQKVVHRTAEDFGTGKLDQVMVSDLGIISLAPAVDLVAELDSPIVWDMALLEGGDIVLGTGNDGKVFRVDGDSGVVTEVADFEEPQVTAVAADGEGHLYAATSPGGRVYRQAGDGRWDLVGEVPGTYVWDMVAPAGGRLLVAGGDPGGILRADVAGFSPLLDTNQLHLLCLLATPDALYAGSAAGGYVYRVAGMGKHPRVSVVLDAPGQEAKALAQAPDGALWALTWGKHDDDSSSDDAPPLSGILDQIDDDGAGGDGAGDITVYRVTEQRPPEPMWRAKDAVGHSLAMLGDLAVVGVGDEGRVVAVGADRHAWLLSDLGGEQVTAMVRGRDGLWIATSNPAVLYRMAEAHARAGTYVSKVIDSGLYATWGRIQAYLERPAAGAVRVETRSGNTETPDDTWTSWKKASGRVGSPPARYLQYRLVLTSKKAGSPRVRQVETYYTPANSRPSLDELTVLDPGIRVEQKESFRSEPAGRGINEPLEPPDEPQVKKKEASGKQSVVWKASDPDGDTLSYTVALRRAGVASWQDLAKDSRNTFVTFDASALPDGWYQVRVVVDDGPSNPPDQVLEDEAVSAPFPVDHTPPVVRLESQRRRGDQVAIGIVARDDTTPLRTGRYAVDGGAFHPIFPADGVFDGVEERFRFEVALDEDAVHEVVIAVEDTVGNVATLDVRVP